MYAIVDIETTGGKPTRDKIIEIAIVRHNGTEIVERFSTLVNPGVPIPFEITRLTGIREDMVREAPRFFEVARRIVELTQDAIFVAHNVRFDYSFIKREFEELGYLFQSKRLCTVRLTRKLIPGLPSYSLGRLSLSLSLHHESRHRALGDAEATAQLFAHLFALAQQSDLEKAIEQETKTALLPPELAEEQVRNLPEVPGVYYFLDAHDNILYIGKSTNLKKRVYQHFQADHKSEKSIEFKNSIRSIRYELAGNELVSLLMESEAIKKHKPPYNRAARQSMLGHGIFCYEDTEGYLRLNVARLNGRDVPLVEAKDHKTARHIVEGLVRKYGLCGKLTHIHRGKGACLDRQLGYCHGACLGEEDPESYNARMEQVLAQFDFPYPHFLLVDQGREDGEWSVVAVENKKYVGLGFFQADFDQPDWQTLRDCVKKGTDHPSHRALVRRWLALPGRHKVIPYSLEAWV